MLTLRRATERQKQHRRARQKWRTFTLTRTGDGARAEGFGSLEALEEERLLPGARVSAHPKGAAEIVTYVREGALAFEDSVGGSGVIQAGEFQRLTLGKGTRRAETNASTREGAQLFQIRLRPAQEALEAGREQQRFSAAMRRRDLCTIASPDRRNGSLLLHLDAVLYSVILSPGQHVAHELGPGRSAWLHLVEGEVTLGDVVLDTGDGAGIVSERVVSITAREDSELLLVDLGGPPPPRGAKRSARSLLPSRS